MSGLPPLPSLRERIARAEHIAELDGIEQEIFGRKHGLFTLAARTLADVPPEEKRRKGQEFNAFKLTVTEALLTRRTELERTSFAGLADADQLDVTLELAPRERGHLHPIPEFIREVEAVFGRMGFDVATGPEVETEDYNFNLLNIPETHPARDAQATFWVKNDDQRAKDQRLVLRTHTSPVQIRYMQSHRPPFRAIFPGKVYRKDADATHSPMFHQFEGLMVGRDVSLANMKAVMIAAIQELVLNEPSERAGLAGPAREDSSKGTGAREGKPRAPTGRVDRLPLVPQFRFRTGFFPFVEPGLEMDMRWEGAAAQSREGQWLEVVGCGMVHPQVLRNCSIDPSKWQGFAFGFGVERMIMIKHQIPDVRSFFENDLRFLRQF